MSFMTVFDLRAVARLKPGSVGLGGISWTEPLAMRDFNEMVRQLRMGGAIDPLQMEAAQALTAMRSALQRIVDSRGNKNWRKPEIVDEAERALTTALSQGA